MKAPVNKAPLMHCIIKGPRGQLLLTFRVRAGVKAGAAGVKKGDGTLGSNRDSVHDKHVCAWGA